MSQTITTSTGTRTVTRVVVGATATLLLAAGNAREITIVNNTAGTMDIGGATVAAGTGLPIVSGGSLTLVNTGQSATGPALNSALYGAYSGGGGDAAVVTLA